MNIPFVNWFWKRETKGINWNMKIADHLDRFTNLQQEYDQRIAHFEIKLNETGLYKDYMGLRNCANELNLEWNRLQFTKDILSDVK